MQLLVSEYLILAMFLGAVVRSLPEGVRLPVRAPRSICFLITVFMTRMEVHAQAALPAFEVASVKPHVANSGIIPPRCANGHLFSLGSTMNAVINWAYDLRFPQVAELDEQLPVWTKRADGIYDFEAKSEEPVSEAQCRLMLQTLLAERFKFAAHREAKEGNFYDLIVAPGGHKLQPMTDADTSEGVNVIINDREVGGTFPGAPVMRGRTMRDLANMLGRFTTDRLLVVDKTGLEILGGER